MPELLDNVDAMAAHGSSAGRYLAGLLRHGTAAMVANSRSRPLLLCDAGRGMPVMVDDGGIGGSYVTNLHSHYVLYARRELHLIAARHQRAAALVGLPVLDAMLRAANINRAVHIDNWLLSTNLHGNWDGAGLPAIRASLVRRFPGHFLVMRSIDSWSCPRLMDALRDDGWVLLPSRQIWVTDDLAHDWQPRNNCANDRRAFARSGLIVEDTGPISPEDCVRIAELYHMLYITRHSTLNPAFTPHFIALSQETGVLSYRVAREPSGRIAAAIGMAVQGGIMTVPLLGYDTSRPQTDALYRISSYLYCQRAMDLGLALHGSSGAAAFKRNRGARGVIEYMAVHTGHLAPQRRAAISVLRQLLQKLVVPAMQREGW